MSWSSNDLFASDDEHERTILVSKIPEEVTIKKLWIHFQKKRNGGGDLEKITMLTAGSALVVFKDCKVASMAVNSEQILNNIVLEVTRPKKENGKKTKQERAVEKEARTVLVSGLFDGVTENNVFIHFQKKKNDGGEVEKVEMLGEGKATVVFESPEVAKKVVAKKQIIRGNVVDVKLVEEICVDERTSEKSETSTPKSCTILVSGLPRQATESTVHIYFQKTKNGGGEVLAVDYFPDKKEAAIVFEDPEVAKRVAEREQIFQGKLLNVKLQNLETTIEEELGEDRKKKERTVVVSDLPEGATENNVFIHFQKRKNGGGEVEKVTVLPGNEAIVLFQDPEVAKRVAEREQIFKGKLLNVKLQSSETTIEAAEEDSSEKERTVLVSDLPEGTTESNVFIHFQKKNNGGGEVEKVTVLPGNVAVVVFEDSEVARRIVTTSQEMKGKVLTVSFLRPKESPQEVSLTPERETASELKMPAEVTTPEVTEEEETRTLEPVDCSEAEKTSQAEEEMKTRRQMEGKAAVPRISTISIDDRVFSVVTATVNPALMTTASQSVWNVVFKVIQSSCGVQCQLSAYGVLLTGSLSQVTRAGEILELKWKKESQNLNQSDMDFVQPGTALNQASMNVSSKLIAPGDTDTEIGVQYYNQGGTNVNDSTTHLNRGDTSIVGRRTAFNQHDMVTSMGSSQEFSSGGRASDGSPGRWGCQQNVHKSLPQDYQQGDSKWENDCTSEFGTPSYNQQLHPGHSVESPNPDGREHVITEQPSSDDGTKNTQPIGNAPKTQPENTASFASPDERERETKSLRSDDGTKNTELFANPPKTQPENTAWSASSDEREHASFKSGFAGIDVKSPQLYIPPNPQLEYTSRSLSADEKERVGTESPKSEDSPKNTQPIRNPPRTKPENATRFASPNEKEREPVSTKSPRSEDDTKNSQPIGNPPEIQPENSASLISPYQREHISTKSPRSDDHTKNLEGFVDPPKTLPENTASFASPNEAERDHVGTKSPRSDDSTKNSQPIRNPPKTQPENTASFASLNEREREHVSTKSPRADDDAKNLERFANLTKTQPENTGRVATAAEKHDGNTKPLKSDVSSKNFKPFKIPWKGSPTTEEDQASGSKTDSTNDKPDTSQNSSTHSARKVESKTPSVLGESPSDTTGLQPPVNERHTTTRSPLTEPGRSTMSDDETGNTDAELPYVPAANHQLSHVNPQSTMLNIANEETVTTSIVSSVPSNEASDFHGEKPAGLPESNTQPQPTGSGNQPDAITEQNIEASCSNSSEQTSSPASKKSSHLTENQPLLAYHTKDLLRPHSDQLQHGITSNTTTGLQNSTTSGNHTAVPAVVTTGSVIDKPYNAAEKTLNDKPQPKPQQTTPNHQTSTPEKTNTETSDNPSKMSEEASSLAKQTLNSNGKPQKQPPIPRPRQSKPGSEKRQNAANFSSPVKTSQARQGNSSPTESKNSIIGEPTDKCNPGKDGQIASTKKEHIDAMLDELD